MVVDAGSSQNIIYVHMLQELFLACSTHRTINDETTYMHHAALRLRCVRKHFLANVIKSKTKELQILWMTLHTLEILETASQSTNCFIRSTAVFRHSRSSIDDNCRKQSCDDPNPRSYGLCPGQHSLHQVSHMDIVVYIPGLITMCYVDTGANEILP